MSEMHLARNVRISEAREDSNFIDVIFATETPVKRYFFGEYEEVNEILSMKSRHIDFTRINNGAAVCDSHDTWSLENVLGVVVKDSAKIKNNQAVCQVRLSDRPEIAGIVSDIRSGIITNISVGYRVLDYEKAESSKEGQVPDILVTKWQPLEVSFVAVPADPHTKSDRQKLKTEQHKELKMTVETPDIEKAEAPVEAVKIENRPIEKIDLAKTLKEERKRIADISKRCDFAKISDDKKEAFINSGKSLAELANEILDEYEANNKQEIKRAYVYNHEDVKTKERHIDALSNALANRSCSSIELKEGREFAQHSMLDIARSLLSRGMNVGNMSSIELARVALTTSDFRKILANTLNKTLQNAYQAEPQTFRPLVNTVTATDFKEMSVNRFGDAPDMLEILEDGEYKYGGIGEESENYKLRTFGRGITLSRQAIINDDLNAFSRLANMRGRAASRLESDIVWDLIKNNGVMSDGNAAFSAAHSNIETTASKVDVATISKVREAFRKQKSVDGKLMNLMPTFLVVPPSLETDAEQLMSTSFLANQVKEINPFSGRFQVISDARLDGVAKEPFYLFCGPGAIDTIEIAYLRGQEGIYLDQQEDFDTDAVKFKCRLDFAAQIIDWRGMYRINSK